MIGDKDDTIHLPSVIGVGNYEKARTMSGLIEGTNKNNFKSTAHIIWYLSDGDKLKWYQGVILRVLIRIKLGKWVKRNGRQM